MMLQNLSWQQFAAFVLIGAAAWYLVVYLLYFRRPRSNGSGSGYGRNGKDGTGDDELDYGGHRNLSGDQGAFQEDSLMGASREDEGVGSVGMHELEFAESGMSADASESGPVADSDSPFADPEPGSLEVLTGRLKDSIAGFSEAGESSKPALLATLAGILREHPGLLESDLLESVLLLLCDYAEEAELPYSISAQELRAALEQ